MNLFKTNSLKVIWLKFSKSLVRKIKDQSSILAPMTTTKGNLSYVAAQYQNNLILEIRFLDRMKKQRKI